MSDIYVNKVHSDMYDMSFVASDKWLGQDMKGSTKFPQKMPQINEIKRVTFHIFRHISFSTKRIVQPALPHTAYTGIPPFNP